MIDEAWSDEEWKRHIRLQQSCTCASALLIVQIDNGYHGPLLCHGLHHIRPALPARPAVFSVHQFVAHQSVYLMVARAEPPELHPLSVLDLLRIAVAPLDGNFAVGIGVDEDVEGAVACELGQERDRGCDLAENSGNLVLDFLFRLFNCRRRRPEHG